MVTAESVKAKLQGLINTANDATGAGDANLTAAVSTLIAGFGQGGGSGVKMTEYVITEDADRSLWLNEQNIKLVKGVNLLVSSKVGYADANWTNAQGAICFVLILWDGVAFTTTTAVHTNSPKSHIRGWAATQSAYVFLGAITSLVAGNTTSVTVTEDGSMTCTTSATEVTTGNHNNSYFKGGYTYLLLQVESEFVC